MEVEGAAGPGGHQALTRAHPAQPWGSCVANLNGAELLEHAPRLSIGGIDCGQEAVGDLQGASRRLEGRESFGAVPVVAGSASIEQYLSAAESGACTRTCNTCTGSAAPQPLTSRARASPGWPPKRSKASMMIQSLGGLRLGGGKRAWKARIFRGREPWGCCCLLQLSQLSAWMPCRRQHSVTARTGSVQDRHSGHPAHQTFGKSHCWPACSGACGRARNLVHGGTAQLVLRCVRLPSDAASSRLWHVEAVHVCIRPTYQTRSETWPRRPLPAGRSCSALLRPPGPAREAGQGEGVLSQQAHPHSLHACC